MGLISFPIVNPCFYAITSYYLSSFASKANIVNLTSISTKVTRKMQCEVSHTLKTRISADWHKKGEKPKKIIDMASLNLSKSMTQQKKLVAIFPE